jgi:hypothetical protein
VNELNPNLQAKTLQRSFNELESVTVAELSSNLKIHFRDYFPNKATRTDPFHKTMDMQQYCMGMRKLLHRRHWQTLGA